MAITVARTDAERTEWFGRCLDAINCCDEHKTDVAPDLVSAVAYAGGDYDDWDTTSFFVVLLHTGLFAVGEEWSDSSGHG